MEGPRAPEEQEYSHLLQFLNDSLRPQKNWSIQEEYPTALNIQHRHNSRILVNDSKVVAHSILKPIIVKTPSILLKAGAIGSVVTHPEHRGKGLAQKTLLSIVEEAKNQSCDIAILWTNLYDYYRKLDFELAGSEISFQINKDLSTNASAFKYLSTSQIDPEAILKLYQQHSVSSFRTAEEIRLYLKIPQSRIYTAWDQRGALAAFAVEGKGADLQNFVHEWGGSVSALLNLFGHMYRERKAPFAVMTPAASVNLITQLYQKLQNIHEGYLGMIKICREDLLFPKIQRAAYACGIKSFHIQPKDGGYLLEIDGDEVFIAHSRDLVRILFGPPQEPSELPPGMQKSANRLLPLPLWVWGWDSI